METLFSPLLLLFFFFFFLSLTLSMALPITSTDPTFSQRRILESDDDLTVGPNLGTIVGAAVSLALVLAVIVVVLYLWYSKKKRLNNANGTVGGEGGGDEVTGDNAIVGGEGGNIFSIEVIRQATENFNEKNILGRGGFGIVYKGQLSDGLLVAVKRMQASETSAQGILEFEAEIGVLTRVRHRNLVGLLGYCSNAPERLLVYEYMPQGTLSQHLYSYEKNGTTPLTWEQRIAIALDIAKGVEYLHSLTQHTFIHRDLKSANILLGDDMRAKVADFGLVRKTPDGKESVETKIGGTFGYIPPECSATGRVTTKVDVYAYGAILMELITGRKALDHSMPEESVHLVTWFRRDILNNEENLRQAIDPTLGRSEETFGSIGAVAELAGYCTAQDPSHRPDMRHTVSILVPLVEHWTPSGNEEDSHEIDIHESLSTILERWQLDEDTTGDEITEDAV